jgi:hypothetical protein
MGVFLKDPAATLDYAIDWGRIAAESAIAASAWSVVPEGDDAMHAVAEGLSGKRTIATLAGGVPGRVYHVTNTVVLNDGRQDARTLSVRVERR